MDKATLRLEKVREDGNGCPFPWRLVRINHKLHEDAAEVGLTAREVAWLYQEIIRQWSAINKEVLEEIDNKLGYFASEHAHIGGEIEALKQVRWDFIHSSKAVSGPGCSLGKGDPSSARPDEPDWSEGGPVS